MNIKELIRPHLLDLEPYSSARHEFSEKADVFLDANENNFGNLLFEEDFIRYPESNPIGIKQKICNKLAQGLQPENIFLGHGSDEALDLLFRAFAEPGKDRIAYISPSYGMYKVLAKTNNIATLEVPLNSDFDLELETIKENWEKISQCKFFFVCTPNNPSGNDINSEAIQYLLDNFKGLVIVDEAYIDFSEKESWLSKLSDYDNLVVTRTFSKAHGLAGLRLGWAAANDEIISVLNSIKMPYNLNAGVLEMLEDYLSIFKQKSLNVKEVVDQRVLLENELKLQAGVTRVFPSSANFILFQCDQSLELYKALLKAGVVVRNRNKDLENSLRVSIGLPEENERFLEVLKGFYNN